MRGERTHDRICLEKKKREREEKSVSKGYILDIITPASASSQSQPGANRISAAVSMVTVALDCYCSNRSTGNSLQPWSLGGGHAHSPPFPAVEAERRGSDRAVLQASDNVNETFEL